MSNEKWTCSICTYINWNASQKCIICQNERSTSQLNQEIYNLEITNNDKITDYVSMPNAQNLSDNRTKWACSACTYLNWPKARKCVQCNTVRYKHSSPTLSQQSISSNSDDQGANTVYTATKSHNTVKCSKENLSEMIKDKLKTDASGKATSSDQLISSEQQQPPQLATDNFSLGKALQKWYCSVCTYENWPKSKQCIMCNSAKAADHSSSDNKTPSKIVTDIPTDSQQLSPTKPTTDKQSLDLLWLEACTSVLNANLYSFESYLLAVDGKLDRELTVQECRILNQPDIFKPGLTLLDVACKLGREDIIELYLSTPCSGSQPTSSTNTFRHRMPCHISPDRALAIQAHLYDTMRMRKGDFPCYVVQEHSTFWLPTEIELLPLIARCQLFNELIDKNVLRELEINEKIINWWAQNTTQNRLTALWNRTAGDCLLDSVLQATWGILDRDNILRTSLAESMREAQHIFYPRWREYERNQARAFNYTINEFQYHRDWQNLLRIACQQGEPLEQVHIFVLCHILRRPIIVYGVKYINNYRNEPVGLAHFQGVYLPLLWEKSFCSRNPIVLGYTRGHFSALVPSESLLTPTNSSVINAALRSHPGTMLRGQMPHETSHGCISSSTGSCLGGLNNYGETVDQTVHLSMPSPSMCLLPLYDCNKQLLPIHFLTGDETQRGETLLRDWLDVAITRRGYLMARMRSSRRHPLVASLIDMWIDRYRHMDDDYDDCMQMQPPHRTTLESIGACSQNASSVLNSVAAAAAAAAVSQIADGAAQCNKLDVHHQQQQQQQQSDKCDDSPPPPPPLPGHPAPAPAAPHGQDSDSRL